MIVHVYDIYYFLFIIYNNIVLHDADTADDTYWCLVPVKITNVNVTIIDL